MAVDGSPSINAANIIAKFEGFVAKAMWDVNGYAVGYGMHYWSDGRTVTQTDTITQDKAKQELVSQLGKNYKNFVKKLSTDSLSKMNQNMIDALYCWAWNNPSYAVKCAELVNKNPLDFNTIGNYWTTHCVKAGGKYLASLKKRREEEFELYKGNTQVLSSNYVSGASGSGFSGGSGSGGSNGGSGSADGGVAVDAREAVIPPAEDKNSLFDVEESDFMHLGGDIDAPHATGEVGFIDESTENQNKLIAMGRKYPVIKIKDYLLDETEIKYFEIDSFGFVPTCYVKFVTGNKEFVKKNVIQEGDRVMVYVIEDNPSAVDDKGNKSGSTMIRPFRMDFIITSVGTSKFHQEIINENQAFEITGELYIPDLHNSNINYAISGTSRDTLIDAAQKLKLGFVFNNPNETNDVQIWQFQPTAKQGFDTFLQDVGKHAWLDENTFFDVWIDHRYNLTFIDFNKQLGVSGTDDSIDLAILTNNMTSNTDITASAMFKEKAKDPHSGFAKLFHNITSSVISNNTFFVKDWEVVNNASSISQEIGLNHTFNLEINNMGIEGSELSHTDVDIKIAYNKDKVGDAPYGKFYILSGPGSTTNYASVEGGNYTKATNHNAPQKLSDVQSDGDAETIAASGSNEMASGNVSITYELAGQHNQLNLLQLEKQYILLTCRGCNQAIMRGDKVPVLLLDRNTQSQVFGPSAIQSEDGGETKYGGRYSEMDPLGSGWFIITGLRWIYKPNMVIATGQYKESSYWETIVKISRREWPIPIDTLDKEKENTESVDIAATVNDPNSTVVESTQPEEPTNTSAEETAENPDENQEQEKTPEPENLVKGDPGDLTKELKEILQAGSGFVGKIYTGKYCALDADNNCVEGSLFLVNRKESEVEYDEEGDLVNTYGLAYKAYDVQNKKITWSPVSNHAYLYGDKVTFEPLCSIKANSILYNINQFYEEFVSKYPEMIFKMYKYGYYLQIGKTCVNIVCASGPKSSNADDFWSFIKRFSLDDKKGKEKEIIIRMSDGSTKNLSDYQQNCGKYIKTRKNNPIQFIS